MAIFRRACQSGTRSAVQVLPALALLACGLAVTACGSSSKSSSSSATTSSAAVSASSSSASVQKVNAGGKTAYFLSCPTSVPYCASFNSNLVKYAAQDGLKVTLLSDTGYDPTVQAQQFNQALAQHPAVIGVDATAQDSLRSQLIKAKQEGVPVELALSVPDSTSKSLVKGYVGQDDPQQATDAAKQMQEGLKAEGVKSGNVLVVAGVQGDAADTLRIGAFKKQMATTPQYKIAEIAYAAWDPVKAATVAQQLYAKWRSKGIVGVWGLSGAMAAGAVQAAQQAGIKVGPNQKGLIVVGTNCANTSVADISKGLMYGDQSQAPPTDAKAVAPVLAAIAAGKSVPSTSYTPSVPISKANVAKYTQACTF
jgi:ABC-type sugar transport system substrate-binding protein